MGYREYLWQMLQPLGVYSGSGFNGGEMTALGNALDQAEQYLDRVWQESVLMSAENDGLSKGETLFPMYPGTETEQRRRALQALWQTDNRCASRTGILKTLEACGIRVGLAALGQFQVIMVFSEPLTIYDEPVFLFWVLEQVMPCHLSVIIRFSYEDVNTKETVTERSSLKILRKRTQSQWEQLLGAYM